MTQYAPRLIRLPIPAAIARSFAVASLLLPGLALAGPTGGVVVGGQATIGNPSPTSTVIHQGSNSAIINWQQFNIGGNEYVQFIQPSSSSVVLNRVIGGSPSEIFGSLSANGRVFLINPNGVLFAPGAQLDVGGLVASTMNIKDADFLSGHYVFAGGSAPGSSVVNGGTIKTGNGGFVVLAGDYVKNTGIIQAKLGQVVLASGSATTLELGSSGLVSFAVDKATLAQKAGVDNAGQIIADGGKVIMTAKTAHDLVGSAVNNSGLVRAQGIASHNGEIELTASGGDIADSGTLDASSATGPGGTVAIAGDRNIAIQPTAQILASGSTGGKIRVVADGTLTTAAGSSIEARGTSGKGGAAELSGHGKLAVRGNVNLGSGGTLLIDPTDLTIADGTGASSSATVFEKFVENQLKNNTDVQLVATNSITLANLSDGTLDGVNPVGYGGSLLLGIGTIDPNSGYVEGNSGSILFANTANTISVYGGLRIDAGSGGGTVKVGNLIAGNIQVQGLGGITAGTITTERGGINLTSGVGNLSFGGLNTKGGDVVVRSSAGTITGGDITTSSGSISVEADAGGIKLGNLSSTYIGSYGGDASITVRSSAGIEVGSVTTDAETTGTFTFQSSSNGNVILSANDFSQPGGDLLINGPISTTAKGANGFNTAAISLSNSAGSITALGALTAHDPGSGGNSAIDITAYGGNVFTGALTATNGSINVSAQATGNQSLPASNGDITLGTLSGGGAPGNALTSVTVDAYGGLTVASDIAASSINLFAGHGDLKAGNINVSTHAFSVADYGGNLTLGDVSAADSISLNDVGGDIKAGNLTSLNGSISASTSSGSGNITLGALSGGSGNELSFVDVSAYGGVTIGGSDIVAGTISLGAGNGNLGAGNLTATRGGITLNDSGGSIAVGRLSASASSSDGSVSAVITAYAAGGISTGSITTSAHASGSFSDAYIQLEANSSRFSTQLGGDLLVAGTISTSASNSAGNADGGISADAGVTLFNGNGGITTGDIDTHASAFAGGLRGNIDLNAFSGNVSTGALTVIDGGAISVSTNTSGDISVGQLSAPGGGLSFVTLSSAGGLTTNGTSIIADQIGLSAANGDLTTGDLTNRVFGLSISDYGGTMTLGTVHSEDGGLALYDSNGGISTGNLFSADNIFITTIGTGGNVKTGTLNANSGTLGTLDIESSGGIDIGGPAHAATTAGVMTLKAGIGDVTTGDLTGTFSSVTVSSGNGNIVLGKVTADGPISITSVGTSNNINGTVVTNGNISTGDLTDTSGNGITVTSSGFGSITVGTLSGSSDGSLGVVTLAAAGALKTTGPAITAGSITLSAGNGDLTAGDLTSTNSGSSVNITDTNGKIIVGTVTARGDIVIHDGGGGIQTQDLRANKGAASILVTSTGSGANIKLGALSGGSTDTPLGTVSLISGGSLATGSSDITAGTITLSAGSGSLAFGNLDALSGALSVNNSGGSITLSSLLAAGDITLTAAGGGITSGNLQAGSGTIKVTSTGSGADIDVGTLGGGSSGLVNVTLSAGGSLSSASTDITAGSIALVAGAGTLSFGALTASSGPLVIGNTGGAVHTGNLTADHGKLTLVSNGALTVGNVSASSMEAVNSGGNALYGDLISSGVIDITTRGGNLKIGNVTANQFFTNVDTGNEQVGNVDITGTNFFFSLGDISGQTLSIGNLSFAAPGNITFGYDNASLSIGNVSVGGGLSVVLGNGNLSAGNIVAGTGAISLSGTHGAITAGNLTASSGAVTVADGSGVNLGKVLAGGNIQISAATGAINTGDLAANGSSSGINVLASGSGGDIALGNLTAGGAISLSGTHGAITAGNLTASSGAVTVADGSGVNLGKVLAGGNIQISAATGAINTGDLAANGSSSGINVLASGSGGDIALGNLTAAGDITLSAAHGALSFGNMGGTNIALSTGQALTVSGRSISAAGSFTLAAGGNTSISSSSIDAGSASLTSSGSLEIANSSVIAQTVTLNASGAIAISGNSLIGTTAQSDLTGGPRPRVTATSSVSLTSGADISIDHSTLRAVQLALNGKGIHLANGAVLNGTNVVLSGTGAVDAAGSSSSIDAGALSVRGGSIDLTDAVLTVGSGSATFGSDSALLARIHAKDPTLVLPTSGPNASFAAAGGVKLGKLSIAGGYLFIEAPTLQLPTALSGNANMFVDFLPTNPAALLNVDLTQPLPGIATLVFGGTPQTGNIQVGDGTQTFALTSNTNLVFATSGSTLYPDSISSNGEVVVLGDSVLRTPPVDLTDIPLTTDQYTIDAPDTSVLAYSGDQGDINDPGVNDANKGRIDIKTSSQQTLSCGIGGGL